MLGMSKDVALTIVKHLGKATARAIWAKACECGLKCSRNAVSMTLKRCSAMNLLYRHKIGRRRYAYTLAPSGARRLKYKNGRATGLSEKKEKVPASRLSEDLQESLGVQAFQTVFERSDVASKAFANYLTFQHGKGVPIEQLVQDAKSFLESQAIFPLPPSESSWGDTVLAAMMARALKIQNENEQARALFHQWIKQQNEDNEKRKAAEMMQESIDGTDFAREQLIRGLLESHVTSPIRIGNSQPTLFKKSGTTELSLKEPKTRPTNAGRNISSYKDTGISHYFPSIARALALVLIDSAREEILLQAPRDRISELWLDGLWIASKKGVKVTLITDDDRTIREDFKKQWNIIKDDKVQHALLVKDRHEVLGILDTLGMRICIPTGRDDLDRSKRRNSDSKSYISDWALT